MFRLQRRAVAFTRIRDRGEVKSLTFEVNPALRIHSTYVFSGLHGAWSVLYAVASPTEQGM
jgi:hypothetical protein